MKPKMQATLEAALPEFSATSVLKSSYSSKSHHLIPLVAAHFEEMPSNGYVRAPVVRELFGISKATMYRWILASRIPAPKKMGRTSLFQVGELRACLEEVQSSGQADSTEGGK